MTWRTPRTTYAQLSPESATERSEEVIHNLRLPLIAKVYYT